MVPHSVFDLENILTEQQIDSLSAMTSEINRDKESYVYVVTIDNFYPDSSIIDFSNRYRDFWAPRVAPKKGTVLTVISIGQRKIRISTGDSSMTYLTDEECSEVIKIMVPYFKEGNHFEGLMNGLQAIKNRL